MFKDGGITPTLIVETKEECKTNMAAHNLMEFISVYCCAWYNTKFNILLLCYVDLPMSASTLKFCTVICSIRFLFRLELVRL